MAYAVPYLMEKINGMFILASLTLAALAIVVMIQCSFTVNGPGLKVKSHRKIRNILRGRIFAISLPSKCESNCATSTPITNGDVLNQKN